MTFPVPPISRHNVVFGRGELRVALRHLRGGGCDESEVTKFELEAAEYLGVREVLAIDSGRKALALALRGLGLKPGDRVLLPEYCFYALVAVVEGLGMEPVYAAINTATFALDTVAAAERVNDVQAVVLIQPFGQGVCCAALKTACEDAGIPLIEDASQSTGALLNDKRVGTLGHVGVFSLVSGKNLHGFGGGMLVTDSSDLAARARTLLEPQCQPSSRTREAFRSNFLRASLTTRLGYSLGVFTPLFLLSEVSPERYEASFHEERASYAANTPIYPIAPDQASMARVGLRRLDARNTLRRRNAEYLRGSLAGTPGLTLQDVDPAGTHSFNAFPVRVTDARDFARYMLRRGVDIRRDYMTWYARPRFPEEVVYLPNHPGLGPREIAKVGRVAREYFR
jgi:dTDP-4-amino-4,6-dideoxygalactose transaminase